MTPVEPANTLCRRVGSSFIALGIGLILANSLATILTDRLVCDMLVIALIPIGKAIRHGKPNAVKLGIACMVFYAIVNAALVVFLLLGSPRLKVGGRAATTDDVPWVLPAMLVLGVWTILNLALLLHVQRVWRRGRRGLCPKCAYDLRATDASICPECGATK